MLGIINLNKPDGISSNDAVNKVKKILKYRKVGHLGTLDPLGCGVLPITVGKATKLFDLYLKKDKVYRAVFVFGTETDTLDSEGKVTNTSKTIPTLRDIESVIPKLVGNICQIPPKYSSKSVNGVRAYNLIRNNIDFDLPPKNIQIYSIKLIKQINNNSFMFDIHCSAGTYIRSICRDMAYELNTFSYMGAIIRLKAGEFTVNSSVTLQDLESNTQNCLIPLETALKEFDIINLDDESTFRIVNGQTLIYALQNGYYFMMNNRKVIALGEVKDNRLKMKIYLKDELDG